MKQMLGEADCLYMFLPDDHWTQAGYKSSCYICNFMFVTQKFKCVCSEFYDIEWHFTFILQKSLV